MIAAMSESWYVRPITATSCFSDAFQIMGMEAKDRRVMGSRGVQDALRADSLRSAQAAYQSLNSRHCFSA